MPELQFWILNFKAFAGKEVTGVSSVADSFQNIGGAAAINL